MKIRIIALLLVFMFMLAATGCENVEYPSESISVESNESADFYEKLDDELIDLDPDSDALPEEQTFLIITNDESVFYTDEQSSGTINTAVETRNKYLQSKYGAIIEAKTKSYNTIASELANANASGNAYCDMLAISAEDSVKLYLSGLLTDLNSLPDFNPESDYFDKKNATSLATNSTLYLLPDPTMQYYNSTYMLFYNRSLLMSKGAVESDRELEKAVMNGKWTWDKYNEIYRLAAKDVINSASANLDTDIFGFSAYYGEGQNAYVMWTSIGKKLIGNNYKNEIKLSLSVDEIVSAARVLDSSYDSKAKLPFEGDDSAIAFQNGRLAFLTHKLSYLNALRDGTDKGSEYGFLPLPKLDENQTEYYSLVDKDARVISVPITVAKSGDDHKRFVSAVITANCAAGGTKMNAAFVNNATSTILFDNAEAYMLKTIIESATFDFAYIFGSRIREIRACTTSVIIDYIDVGSDISNSIARAKDSFNAYCAKIS